MAHITHFVVVVGVVIFRELLSSLLECETSNSPPFSPDFASGIFAIGRVISRFQNGDPRMVWVLFFFPPSILYIFSIEILGDNLLVLHDKDAKIPRKCFQILGPR